MSLTVDPNNFIDSILFVEEVAGRSVTDSMNRAGKHIIIGSGSYAGAMQLTPKANKADIDKVSDAKIRGAVVNRMKRTGRWPQPSAEINRAVRRERSRRKAACGYHAWAGWSKAAQAFGGRGVKGVNSGFNRSLASQGYGRKAKMVDKTAVLANTAPAIERIGFGALQDAVNNAAQDLVDYGNRKLQEQFNRVNP